MNDKEQIVQLLDKIGRLQFELDNTKAWLERAEAIVECYIEETDEMFPWYRRTISLIEELEKLRKELETLKKDALEVGEFYSDHDNTEGMNDASLVHVRGQKARKFLDKWSKQ